MSERADEPTEPADSIEPEDVAGRPATWENLVVGEAKELAGEAIRDKEMAEEGEEQKEIAHEVREAYREER